MQVRTLCEEMIHDSWYATHLINFKLVVHAWGCDQLHSYNNS